MSKQHSQFPPTTKDTVSFSSPPEGAEQKPATKSPNLSAKLDGEIASASAALKQTSQPSSSEGHFDKLASSVSSMGLYTRAIDIQAIESNIGGWAESSKVFMRALDAVATIHPIVGAVVLAFKAVVTLEMTRRECNKKLIALHLQMQEMMSVLLQLRGIDNPDDQSSDGVTLSHRLEPLMIKIAKDITECGNVCDAYSKTNILVKVLKSLIYEQRFASYITTFGDRQREIQFALILHTSLTVESAASKIDSVHDKASSADHKLNLLILFRRLDSPHESELMKFIETEGGVEKCMADDKALLELAEIRRRLQGGPVVVNTSPQGASLSGEANEGTTSGPSFITAPQYQSSRVRQSYLPSRRPYQLFATPYPHGSTYAANGGSRYGSTSAAYGGSRHGSAIAVYPSVLQTRGPMIATVHLDTLKSELSEDVDLVLNRNMVGFLRRLDLQQRHLVPELTAVVKRQTDTLIEKFDAGPHDRIVDPDFHAIWKGMRWGTCVKARTFVFAIHAYFTERFLDADVLTSGTPKTIQEFRRVQALANEKVGDLKAMEYISIVNLRPILESFDDDQSGYITIREVNSFTAAKPEYMSLPEWISYWAVGWHFILCEYKTKICGIITNIYDSRKHLLPTNRAMVDMYLDSLAIHVVDLIVDPLEPFATELDANMKQKSLRYAKEEEERMEANLKLVAYEIDTPDTLAQITGSGRIEKYLFPLLFLLLRHHSRIISVAAREILAREELHTAAINIGSVLGMVDERICTLSVVFKELYVLHDDIAVVLSRKAFGMFAKFGRDIEVSMENLQGSYEDDDKDAFQGQLLKYRVEELDCTIYDLIPIVSPTILAELSHPAIESIWSGFVKGGDGNGLFQIDFPLYFAHVRTLQGSGLDVNGPFEVLGNVRDDGSFAVVLQREDIATVSDRVIPLYLWGKLESSKSKLQVEWGTRPGLMVGEMTLYPGSAGLTRFRWDTVPSRTPAQIRWSFACSAILDRVRAKMWCWSFFKDRRDKRRDYTTLYRRQYLLGSLEGDDVSKLATLEKTLSPLDVRFYRSICRSHYSICHHLGIFCDICQKDITGDRYKFLTPGPYYEDAPGDFCFMCINSPSEATTQFIDAHLRGPPDELTLLKFSRFVQRRELSGFINAAMEVLSLPQHPPTVCNICHSIGKPPYWCCVICREDLMICETCDPQRLLEVHPTHDESHPMLRIKTAEYAASENTASEGVLSKKWMTSRIRSILLWFRNHDRPQPVPIVGPVIPSFSDLSSEVQT